MSDYDKDLINREVIAVCDHYLTNRRGEGKRQTYLCPACGDRNFEVDPQLGYAGCFDAVCEVPRSTDALGIIAYFEGKSLSGEGFVMCLKKGYEILGLSDPEDDEDSQRSSTNGNRPKAMTARKKKTGQRERAMTPRADRGGGQEKASENGAASFHSSGPQWGAATSSEPEPSNTMLTEQPIQAWQENEDGTRSAVAAVVISEPEPEADTEGGEEVEEAELAGESQHQAGTTDDRQTAHEVFEELLRLCRREERDETFLRGRGLDKETIQEGRFGSISKSRCNAVISRLRQKFSEGELLSVPGFRKAESGQIRFSLYGDYTLLPYYDGEGYIRTVEGRFTGKEIGEYDKKYKALLNSAVHLYVHPRYKPEEVVAICEGAIGAMVAARYGFAVASIKGLRNYRRRVDGNGAAYTVLPELEGVDFAGKVVVYIPDLDVKPQTREEAFSLVPEACQWMIERQGGVPKVAMLPEGAKDLDAWILSLNEEEREQKIGELLEGALPLEQFKQKYLNTEESDISGDGQGAQPTTEQVESSGSDSSSANESEMDSSSTGEPQDNGQTAPSSNSRRVFGGSSAQDGRQSSTETTEPDTDQQPLEGFTEMADGAGGNQEGHSAEEQGESQSTPNRREYSKGSGKAKPGDDSGDEEGKEQEGSEGGEGTAGEEGSDADEEEGDSGSANEEDQGSSRKAEDEEDTTELEPVTEETGYEPPPAFEVSTRGEWALTTLAYVTSAVLLTILINVVSARYLSWLGPPPWWWGAGLAAFIAIWVTVGFRKLRKSQKAKNLRRHIEGPDV